MELYKKGYIILIIAFCSMQLKAALDYNDVATIFYKHCTSCHHDNGSAGFSLMTYNDVSAYTSSIQVELITDHMPPWLPDTAYNSSTHPVNRFLHETIISSDEKNKILDWIDQGAAQGNPALAPAPPVYNTKYKLNGNPDVVLKIPTFTSNATSLNSSFNCFALPIGQTTERWLRAYEIIAGNYNAVAHITLSIDTTGTVLSDVSGNCYAQLGDIYLGRWTPGLSPTVYPNSTQLKAGLRIPANSKLIMRIEYKHASAGLTDSSKVRMFFYPENETGIREIHSDVFLQYWGATIKPDISANAVKTFTITPAIQTVPHSQPPLADISLIALSPQSNNICIQMHNYAVNGSDTIPLVNIKQWYYQWQNNYMFSKPVKVPSNYTLKAEHIFDNTSNNQHQPNSPVKHINFGSTPDDETIYDAFQWMYYQTGDELIDIKSIVAQDDLFAVGITEYLTEETLQAFVYPIPASDRLTIYMPKISNYTARIFNSVGQNILQSYTFKDVINLDVSTLSSGLYFLEINDRVSKESTIKKIVISD